MKGTDGMLESFVNTDKILKKIEINNAALEALEPDAYTDRGVD